MKPLSIIWLFLSLLCLASSCKKSPTFDPEIEPTSTDCWNRTDSKIIFTQLASTTISPPSKISVFFKLDDKEGKAIPNLTEVDFNIYEQTMNSDCSQPISTFEGARSVNREIQKFTHTTFILLDLSGSILTNFSEEIKKATTTLVNEINPSPDKPFNNIGIYWFDGAAAIHPLIAPSFDKASILQSINNLENTISQDNSTNLYGAVTAITQQANDLLTSDDNIAGVSILLFTDGQDRANRVAKEVAYQAIDSTHAAVSFFTVGLGEEVNEEDLKKFGKDKFVNIQAVEELNTSFKEIAQSVEDEANSYYLLEYCSPSRGGTNNVLIIEAIHGEQKGYLESSFSAEGFEGGCEI